VPHTHNVKSFVIVSLVIVALLSTACSADANPQATPTFPPLVIITSTLPPTQTARPSATLPLPTATVLVAPVEGQTTSQLNVRDAPSAEGALLGTIPIFTKIQIVGKDPASAWWMIVYPEGPSGTGWVTAQFVLVTSGAETVPVYNSPTQSAASSPDPVTTPETETGPTVEPGSAPAPSPASPPADQSLASAFEDGDSSQAPAVSIALSKSSVRSFNYSSDVSSPSGDPEDWIQFRLDGQTGQPITVSVVLNCTGSGALSIELMQNNSVLQGWQEIPCGHPSQLVLNLFVGAPYTLHLTTMRASDIQKYINYTLSVALQ
jgi:uncharacterized protein YraI